MKNHQRIRALREARCISMRQLARELGLSHNMISKWERDPDNCLSECALPTRANVLALAKYFQVTPGWLMFGEIEHKPSRQKVIQNIQDMSEKDFRRAAKAVEEIIEKKKNQLSLEWNSLFKKKFESLFTEVMVFDGQIIT